MRKHPPSQSNNYEAKVVELGLRLRRDDLAFCDIDVKHDSWCDAYGARVIGPGCYCNCDPEVTLRKGHLLGR